MDKSINVYLKINGFWRGFQFNLGFQYDNLRRSVSQNQWTFSQRSGSCACFFNTQTPILTSSSKLPISRHSKCIRCEFSLQKTNTTGWKITIFNRGYRIHLQMVVFPLSLLLFWGSYRKGTWWRCGSIPKFHSFCSVVVGPWSYVAWQHPCTTVEERNPAPVEVGS